MDTENICPACGDEYDEQASQCRRVWSDYHDNIVCVTCKETAPVTDTDPTPPHGTPRPAAPIADKWTETRAERVTLTATPSIGCLFCQIAGRPFTPSRYSMTWAGNTVEVCTDCIGGALEARKQAETPAPAVECPYCAQTVARDDWDSRGFCVWCYDAGQVPCLECHELGRMLDDEARCFTCVYHPEHHTLD